MERGDIIMRECRSRCNRVNAAGAQSWRFRGQQGKKYVGTKRPASEKMVKIKQPHQNSEAA